MALDHIRLGLENKFLKNKPRRIFCVRQIYCTKSCQQIWVRVNQPFILFMHHFWGETVLWGAVFIIQISDKMQYFTTFQDKLHSFNIQNRTKLAWAFSKTVQKISKITYTASRFSLLTSAKFAVNIKVRFNTINKNSVKHLQRQQFSFTKTSIKVSPESLSVKFKFMF